MANFCGKCGSKLEPVTKSCPKCSNIRKPVHWRRVLAGMTVVLAILGLVLTFSGRKRLDEPLRGTELPLQDTVETERRLSKIQKYDENGALRGEVVFAYEKQSITNVLTRDFNENGIKSGEQIYPIEYDADGRIIRYGDIGAGRYEEFEYDADGILIRHGKGEGGYVETYYEYDAQGRLEETMSTGEGADFVSHYVYDSTGKCIRRDDYTYYDETYCEGRTYDLKVYQYQYDELGNLISISGDGNDTSYTYDELGRKTSEVIRDPYDFVYTTRYDYQYKDLVICNYHITNNKDFTSSYSTADYLDNNGFLLFSYYLGDNVVLTADENGYLSQVTDETGETIEFHYLEM